MILLKNMHRNKMFASRQSARISTTTSLETFSNLSLTLF